MKAIIAVIAAIGAMSSLVGSANADVSINLSFSSSPSYRSTYYYPERYRHYHHHHQNANSRVIVREVYPSTVIYSSKSSERRYNSSQENRYGDRYIVERYSR
jgi:hypothetical protein